MIKVLKQMVEALEKPASEDSSVAQHRTWVGLTDEEIEKLVLKFRDAPINLVFAVQAKIKEKNI